MKQQPADITKRASYQLKTSDIQRLLLHSGLIIFSIFVVVPYLSTGIRALAALNIVSVIVKFAYRPEVKDQDVLKSTREVRQPAALTPKSTKQPITPISKTPATPATNNSCNSTPKSTVKQRLLFQRASPSPIAVKSSPLNTFHSPLPPMSLPRTFQPAIQQKVLASRHPNDGLVYRSYEQTLQEFRIAHCLDEAAERMRNWLASRFSTLVKDIDRVDLLFKEAGLSHVDCSHLASESTLVASKPSSFEDLYRQYPNVSCVNAGTACQGSLTYRADTLISRIHLSRVHHQPPQSFSAIWARAVQLPRRWRRLCS